MFDEVIDTKSPFEWSVEYKLLLLVLVLMVGWVVVVGAFPFLELEPFVVVGFVILVFLSTPLVLIAGSSERIYLKNHLYLIKQI
jgi:hypothetical protein